MRFMMLVQLPCDTSADQVPDLADAVRMQRYNEDLTRAGVLLAGDGLHAPAEGVRLECAGGRCRVLDSPDARRRELVGGYWLLQVSSKEEAVEWARRCPIRDGDAIEVRRVRETTAFPFEIREVARLSPLPPGRIPGRRTG
jgi:hypothetical protein